MNERHLDPRAGTGGNIAEYTVSEISQAVRGTLESTFGRVRVRGEVGQSKQAASGHLYFNIKDADASMDAVAWRGTAQRLSVRLSEGMEIICTGRISSYPKSSRYQIIVDSVELAGEGALLKLLEERRRKLAAEGLFDEDRKRPLPALPDVIGVVTSPTGAVIRDILHRLEDRFPRHVLIWPVPVQGDGAGDRIAEAISGFNALPTHGETPRPDLLIVARGGGSLEDLWEFNQEAVVRAAAASEIPLISAVGHETDTTLIDFAADHRAPTPTAAAERAVPVRAELHARTLENEQRMRTGMERVLIERRTRLEGLVRGLPWPTSLLERAMQSLDHATEQLVSAMRRRLDGATSRVSIAGAGLRSPQDVVDTAIREVSGLGGRLAGAMSVSLQQRALRLEGLRSDERMTVCFASLTTLAGGRLSALGDRLEDLSSQRVLERGFAMIEDQAGGVISSSAATRPGQQVSIRFSDGQVPAKVGSKQPKRSRVHPGQGSFL